jgi:hypothetical protein
MKKLYPLISAATLLGLTMTLPAMAASRPAAAHQKTARHASAGAASCLSNVGGSGLSAAVVAKSGQTIAHKTIDAAGCDIGIYVGPGVSGVTIDAVKVTGASFQGILAEKTSHLKVEHSILTGNGFKTIDKSAPKLPSGVHSLVSQSFAISLFGVSDAMVMDNKVYNNGRGGIGVMDNGPNNPGTITQDHSAPVVGSANDMISGNKVWKNYNGCGIVLATQNVGGTLSNMVVTGNVIHGTGISRTNGPDIGGLVVAADLPNSTVSNVTVSHNRVTGSFEGGLIVNAEAPGSSTQNVRVVDNLAAKNNIGHLEAPNTAGIIIFAATAAKLPPKTNQAENIGTVVSGNTESGQVYRIWSSGDNQISVLPK